MINAKEARKMTEELSNSSSTDELSRVEKLIDKAIKQREFSTQPIGGILKDTTIKRLEDLGYKIEIGGIYCSQTIIKW
ncbi:hypothetical protein [uncultured Clostridium sp.]|uniref:hypothetical protein n=1 Tax=uncultured Clostridium sp. TaxID=59620 RepID=UPI0028EC757C|nr:hypothetical protein [uncultured Clostridium sp.]